MLQQGELDPYRATRGLFPRLAAAAAVTSAFLGKDANVCGRVKMEGDVFADVAPGRLRVVRKVGPIPLDTIDLTLEGEGLSVTFRGKVSSRALLRSYNAIARELRLAHGIAAPVLIPFPPGGGTKPALFSPEFGFVVPGGDGPGFTLHVNLSRDGRAIYGCSGELFQSFSLDEILVRDAIAAMGHPPRGPSPSSAWFNEVILESLTPVAVAPAPRFWDRAVGIRGLPFKPVFVVKDERNSNVVVVWNRGRVGEMERYIFPPNTSQIEAVRVATGLRVRDLLSPAEFASAVIAAGRGGVVSKFVVEATGLVGIEAQTFLRGLEGLDAREELRLTFYVLRRAREHRGRRLEGDDVGAPR